MKRKGFKRFKTQQVHKTEYSEFTNEFSFDALDNWKTTTGLIKSVIECIEKNIPGCTAHLFYHVSETHEYREADREGIATVPEDSLFIGTLSMLPGMVEIKKLFTEYPVDEPLLEQLFTTAYSAEYVIPVVHGFNLLSFILICNTQNDKHIKLTDRRLKFLKELTSRIQTSLYASSIADQRQRELLKMSGFPAELTKYKNLNDIYKNVLNDIHKQIPFDKGVFYLFDEQTKLLLPYGKKNIRLKLKPLKQNESISGQVFARNNSILVPDRNTHPTYSHIKGEGFIKGSFIAVPITSGTDRIGLIVLVHTDPALNSFGSEQLYMLQIAASFLSSEISNRKLFTKLDDSNFLMVKSLTRALEAKDSYTEGHSTRVTKYAVQVAERLNYSPEKIHLLRYGALLHDIGKIGISDSLINKHSKLTEEEFAVIRSHTEIGYNILSGNPVFNTIKDFVRFHHEKLDGSGYYGMKKNEFPEEAMIISIADIFDALTFDRPYRKAMTSKEAVNELRKQIGIHFTEPIFNAFYAYLKENDFKIVDAD